MSRFDSDNINNLRCDACNKSYERRDLLMRHRRRCQGPQKLFNRRKACNACVQAKTKCCYTQPTCTRCTKRGTRCVYASSSASSNRGQSEQRSEAPTTGTIQSNLQPSFAQSENFATMTESYDMELPAWDLSGSPFSLGNFDMNLADLLNPTVILPESTSTQSASLRESPDFTLSSEARSPNSLSRDASLLSSSTPRVTPKPASIVQPNETGSSAVSPPSASHAHIRLLNEYPLFLMKDGSASPFLHHSLYSDAIPDITFLPLTSMAICCGSGINLSDRSRFFRRAMDAERQRLIGDFPSYQCMQQWDALHAMLIYEDLELRECIWDELELWKHNPRGKGLRSPFLLKMIQCYVQSYPEIRNPDINVFSDPQSVVNSSNTSTWARWVKTETARRTIFFANILNFYSNRNHTTGKQLPYYEPLDDELILNMPLPCNQSAWLASNEDDWKSAIQNPSLSLISRRSSSVNGLEGTTHYSGDTLKTIFSQFNKDGIQVELGKSVGFSDSIKLRNLIILCASEQYI